MRGRLFATAAAAPARAAAAGWVVAGLLVGALLALLMGAPARWAATALQRASAGQLLLVDARGTLWAGSALVVLSGGPGSRQASALPGRLHWTLGIAPGDWRALQLALRQACCITDTLRLRVEPGLGRLRISLPAQPGPLGQWPASWLGGLGAPFNTLRLSGLAQLGAAGLAVEWVQGRWRIAGQATLELQGMASALAPVDPLGSYRLVLSGGGGSAVALVELQTLQGPLRLSGSGQWHGAGLRFRGQAQADPGSEALLNNLLNLLGQRQGAQALLAIG